MPRPPETANKAAAAIGGGNPLEEPLGKLKGLGRRRRELLAARGIRTIREALRYLPRDWRVLRRIDSISELAAGEFVCFAARVVRPPRIRNRHGRRATVEMSVGDAGDTVRCLWFNIHPASLLGRFHSGDLVSLVGAVSEFEGSLQLVHPEIERAPAVGLGAAGPRESLVPVYPEVEGLSPRLLRGILGQAVEKYGRLWPEIVPPAAGRSMDFPPAEQVIGLAHFPPPGTDLRQLAGWRTPAQRRLIFEEMLVLQAGLAVLRERVRRGRAAAVDPLPRALDLAPRLFGFEFTPAQAGALEEILADLSSGRPMNRLLQGEVGSGKTAVALLAALAVARSGGQSAFMAPTELLAEQHFEQVKNMLRRDGEAIRLRAALLTSSVTGPERRRCLGALKKGEIDLLIGTHALLEPGVEFDRLDLCLIDEQHRFGVAQRAGLRRKGRRPHLLVMTATPIPRTLAMVLYGDLDVSVMDELPPGRRPVRTVVLAEGEFGQALDEVRRRAAEGGQSYLVCPLVEESERSDLADASRMFDRLRQGELKGLRLGLLHGRLPSEQKARVMRAFCAGELDVLVATTVVEVGLDVPNACLMVVEHAERFGLSQLHQLRGRVGRGPRTAACYLICHGEPTAEARSRLQVMEATQDGFVVAERDLALRGPGDFFGMRQSGLPLLTFADLARDADLLHDARLEAAKIVASDPGLSRPEHAALKEALERGWGNRVFWTEGA